MRAVYLYLKSERLLKSKARWNFTRILFEEYPQDIAPNLRFCRPPVSYDQEREK